MKDQRNQTPIKKSKLHYQASLLKAMVIKEFKHVIRDRRSLFFLLAQPVMMMVLFGFALSNEVKESKVVIIDKARDEISRQLIDRNRELAFED